jgi:hypothetical protein
LFRKGQETIDDGVGSRCGAHRRDHQAGEACEKISRFHGNPIHRPASPPGKAGSATARTYLEGIDRRELKDLKEALLVLLSAIFVLFAVIWNSGPEAPREKISAACPGIVPAFVVLMNLIPLP